MHIDKVIDNQENENILKISSFGNFLSINKYFHQLIVLVDVFIVVELLVKHEKSFFRRFVVCT